MIKDLATLNWLRQVSTLVRQVDLISHSHNNTFESWAMKAQKTMKLPYMRRVVLIPYL